jgi:hypothetical protein
MIVIPVEEPTYAAIACTRRVAPVATAPDATHRMRSTGCNSTNDGSTYTDVAPTDVAPLHYQVRIIQL